MESTGITIFDWAVIGVVGLSALLALFRGFVREVLSLAAWMTAAFVTVNCYAGVGKFLEPHIASSAIRLGVSTVGLFLTVLVLAAIINSIIMRFLNAGGDIGMLDSVLGMLFGILRGLFIIALAYLMLAMVFVEKENYPDWLKDAKTLPIVERSADMLETLAPKYVQEARKITSETSKNAEEMKAIQEKSREIEELRGKKDPSGISDSKRKDLERLLEGLEREKKIDPEAMKKLQESL